MRSTVFAAAAGAFGAAAAAVALVGLRQQLLLCFVLVLLDVLARVAGKQIAERIVSLRTSFFGGRLDFRLHPITIVDAAAVFLLGPLSIAAVSLLGALASWAILGLAKARKETGGSSLPPGLSGSFLRGAAGALAASLGALVPIAAPAGSALAMVGYAIFHSALRALEGSLRYNTRYRPSFAKEIVGWYPKIADVALGFGFARLGLGYCQAPHGVLLLVGLAPVVVYSARTLEDGRAMYCGALQSLAKAVEHKDPFREDHSLRTAAYAAAIARKALLGEDIAVQAYWAGLTHDLGNIGVAESILRREGPLPREEFAKAMEHCAVGSSLLTLMPYMPQAAIAVKHHHERWDGSGYPDGLSGEDIPVIARVVALADAYDALTSPRSFRPAMSRPEALETLRACAGKAFDPGLVPLLAEAAEEEAVWGNRVFRGHYSVIDRG